MKYYRMVYQAKDSNNKMGDVTGSFVDQYKTAISQDKENTLLAKYVDTHQQHLKEATVIACEEISKERYELLLTSQLPK